MSDINKNIDFKVDSKTFGIGILTLTAVALLIANVFTARTVIAEESVSNDDVQAVTARTTQGGDALYLLDHDTGKLAVFTTDARNGIQLRAVQDLETAFQAGGGGRGGRDR